MLLEDLCQQKLMNTVLTAYLEPNCLRTAFEVCAYLRVLDVHPVTNVWTCHKKLFLKKYMDLIRPTHLIRSIKTK